MVKAIKVKTMFDVTIPAGPGIPHGLIIPAGDLTEQFSRSSGPGGQGVNTTDSKVQLSLDIAATGALDDAQKERVMANLRHHLDGTVLNISASTHRHQLRNRKEARQRMAAILREALAPPAPQRKRTQPTRGSIRRRLENKRHRSELKAARRRPARDF